MTFLARRPQKLSVKLTLTLLCFHTRALFSLWRGPRWPLVAFSPWTAQENIWDANPSTYSTRGWKQSEAFSLLQPLSLSLRPSPPALRCKTSSFQTVELSAVKNRSQGCDGLGDRLGTLFWIRSEESESSLHFTA